MQDISQVCGKWETLSQLGGGSGSCCRLEHRMGWWPEKGTPRVVTWPRNRKGKRMKWKQNTGLKTKICKDSGGTAGPQQQKIGAGYPDWSSCPEFPPKGHFQLATMVLKSAIASYLTMLLGILQNNQFLVLDSVFLSSLVYCWSGSAQNSDLHFTFEKER